MMGWDELCPLCGIAPDPPHHIYADPITGADDLTTKIIDYDPSLLDDMEMDEDTLRDMLEKILEMDPPGDPNSPRWHWEGFENCIAVGSESLMSHENFRMGNEYKAIIPDGKGVEVRLVSGPQYGVFSCIIHRAVDEAGNAIQSIEKKFSNTSSNINLDHNGLEDSMFGNFFLSEGCFRYLQAWLDFGRFPPPQHDRQLSFAGELYEVVNSRKDGRWWHGGILPYINYDGIEDTLMDQYQDQISENLYDAQNNDNRWPTASENFTVDDSLSKFPLSAIPSDMLACLPSDMLFEIIQLSDSLPTYLTLARTSKWLYNTLTSPLFLNRTLRAMTSSPSGCLFWTKPVASMLGEEKKAYEAVTTFLLHGHAKIDAGVGTTNKEKETITPAMIPFDRADFPWYYFVKCCFASDSMKNRKRIWGQVKQFEELWKDYRENGWEVDRFGDSNAKGSP
ncbi:hypothetical protein CPB84DRAFT_1746072 [Gymnopilus junonius]|uniref:F-box domain-containing protein n=1 Tax=Gymnopilus junonius TaxID=109634 RepID=A0A9P5NSC0_GYMJU|nr:hypothetical protein CPB84DRAFT_1746072 [Gymnopilus junonius]